MPQLQLYCIYFFHMNLYPFCTDCLLLWFWPINVAVCLSVRINVYNTSEPSYFLSIHLFSLYLISFKRSLSLPLPHHFYFLSFFTTIPWWFPILEGIVLNLPGGAWRNSYRYSKWHIEINSFHSIGQTCSYRSEPSDSGCLLSCLVLEWQGLRGMCYTTLRILLNHQAWVASTTSSPLVPEHKVAT